MKKIWNFVKYELLNMPISEKDFESADQAFRSLFPSQGLSYVPLDDVTALGKAIELSSLIGPTLALAYISKAEADKKVLLDAVREVKSVKHKLKNERRKAAELEAMQLYISLTDEQNEFIKAARSTRAKQRLVNTW